MMNFSLLTLLGLSQVLLQCEGRVYPSSNGTSFTIASGSTARIVWTFDDVIQPFTSRSWSFKRDGPFIILASVVGNGSVTIVTRLFDFEAKKPATLILRNVDETYNGTYRFILAPSSGNTNDEVSVFIAVTPNITINCSNPTTVNQSEYFTCECKGTGGNPPADVTWYKDNTLIVTRKLEAILRFTNIDKDDSGTYICEAKSGIEEAKNETEFELIVNYPPEIVERRGLILERSGQSVYIECAIEGRPEPSFKIFFNETVSITNNKTYTIPEVNNSHVGNYTCFAENILGNAFSDPEYLSLVEHTTTPLPTTIAPSPSNKTSRPVTSSSTAVPPKPKPTPKPTSKPTSKPGPHVATIVGIVVGVLVLILIIVVVLYYCKKRARNGYKGNANVNPDDGNVGVNHYELEEDNAYDSVKGDNAYDSANPPGSSASTSKPPEDTMPPVYAAVDKDNRKGKTLYATLDSVALESDGSQKRKDDRPPPTEYADINFLKKEPDQNAGEAV